MSDFVPDDMKLEDLLAAVEALHEKGPLRVYNFCTL